MCVLFVCRTQHLKNVCSPINKSQQQQQQHQVCDYTGQSYCPNCHWGVTSPSPARILSNWDFTPQPMAQVLQSLFLHDFTDFFPSPGLFAVLGLAYATSTSKLTKSCPWTRCCFWGGDGLTLFIGPRSDHSLPMKATDWLRMLLKLERFDPCRSLYVIIR